MNILLIGSGGREHCMAWKLAQSDLCNQLFIAPGNAGTASVGTNLPIDINDFENLAKACEVNKVDMLVVGPEEPLVNGITDYFKNRKSTSHITVIGPTKMASQLEGSKAYAKTFMKEFNIPTPAYKKFTIENFEEGIAYLKEHPLPIVLKADGLAAGKGVIICQNTIEALSEFELMIKHSKFGEAGKKLIVEQYLDGVEMSVFVLTDGLNYVLLPEAKDYKKIGEGDTGLNTGGMGAVSPVPFFDAALKEKVISKIIEPTLEGIRKRELEYCGFIFFGLFICNNEPYIIEYNCRLGDPETEVVLPRLQNDLVKLFSAARNKKLKGISVETDERAATAVVAVSEGYPGNYTKGKEITGLNDLYVENSLLFHAGTKNEKGRVLTNGGRVLVATSLANDINDAVEQSNYVLETLHFEGINFRKDIGFEFRNKENYLSR